MKNLSILFIAIIFFACHKSKEADPAPTCYNKADIVGKHLKNYKVNTYINNPEKGYYFRPDSLFQDANQYKVTYSAGFDSVYVYYSPTAISAYFIQVNGCSEFTITQGLFTTYLR